MELNENNTDFNLTESIDIKGMKLPSSIGTDFNLGSETPLQFENPDIDKYLAAKEKDQELLESFEKYFRVLSNEQLLELARMIQQTMENRANMETKTRK